MLSTITRMPEEDCSQEVLLVVPTLGKRMRFLEQTLESIRSQEIAADSVLVSPSTDAELADLASQFNAQLIPDPGALPQAINEGVETGWKGHHFVGWLNDDDVLEPRSLRVTSDALKARPDAVVAFGSCRYVDTQGRELWVSSAGKWAPRVLGWGPDLIPQPGMLIRSKAWKAVGGLDTSYRLAFDLDLLLRLRKLGALVDVDCIVSSFRWHADSLTVDDRQTNIAESERAKRAQLGPTARKFSWLWEPPVRWATRAAVRQVNRRAQQLAAR